MGLAAKIKRNDNHREDTDILNAAQAVCDIYSTHLLTIDREIIESQEIDRVSKEFTERIYKLKISESIKSK